MSNDYKKTIRITTEMKAYIEDIAKKLNVSENVAVKFIIFKAMEK